MKFNTDQNSPNFGRIAYHGLLFREDGAHDPLRPATGQKAMDERVLSLYSLSENAKFTAVKVHCQPLSSSGTSKIHSCPPDAPIICLFPCVAV
jgi:hypothetical protein